MAKLDILSERMLDDEIASEIRVIGNRIDVLGWKWQLKAWTNGAIIVIICPDWQARSLIRSAVEYMNVLGYVGPDFLKDYRVWHRISDVKDSLLLMKQALCYVEHQQP